MRWECRSRECGRFFSTSEKFLCSIFDNCKNIFSTWEKETETLKFWFLSETLSRKRSGRKRSFQFIYLSHSLQSRSTVKTNLKVIHKAFLVLKAALKYCEIDTKEKSSFSKGSFLLFRLCFYPPSMILDYNHKRKVFKCDNRNERRKLLWKFACFFISTRFLGRKFIREIEDCASNWSDKIVQCLKISQIDLQIEWEMWENFPSFLAPWRRKNKNKGKASQKREEKFVWRGVHMK